MPDKLVVPLSKYFNLRILKGKTIDIEFEEIQKELIPIYIYYIEPQDIILKNDEDEKLVTFVSAIDIDENTVKAEMEIALSYLSTNLNDGLYIKHANYFSNIWKNGRIEVDNYDLQKTIYASSYYLISSLPSLNHYGKLNQFYGLSPGSLSRGSNLSDYQGYYFFCCLFPLLPKIKKFLILTRT